MRPILCSFGALALILSGPPAAAAAAVAPPAEDTPWVVMVLPDAPAEAVPPGRLTPELLSGAEALWVGSPGRPPRRLEPPFPAPGAILGANEEAARVPLAVEVSVPDAEARSRRGELGRLIAAPVAMWEEVPEPLLPSWALSSEGRLEISRTPGEAWRVRHVALGVGSWWTEAPAHRSAVRVDAWEAEDPGTTVVGPDGEPVEGAQISVIETSNRPRGAGFLARFAVDERGGMRIPSLPDAETASFVFGAPGRTARAWTGVPGALPERFLLPPGRELSGHVVDPDEKPLSGVEVAAEAWIEDDAHALFLRSTTTGEDGAWSLAGVPRREALLRVSKEGYVPHRERIGPDAASGDRGTLVLRPGVALELEVVDGEGLPVPGARVSGRGVSPVSSDGNGIAVLTGLPPASSARLTLEAEGFVEARELIPAPLPASHRVAMKRAFHLVGRFVGPDGTPVEEGAVFVEAEGCPQERHEMLPGGRFDLDAEPDAPLRLTLVSSATRRLELSVEPGLPGEVRDLGDLEAPPGLTVTGRVTSAADGLPLPGARVWVPRPSPGGPALSWLHRDLVEARSGEDGTFTLTGLQPGPSVIRFEAPGHARAHRSLSPEEGVFELDVGEVELPVGGRVRVVLSGEDAREPAVAILDLGGAGDPADEIVARVEAGVGVLGPVPAGRARLEVRRTPQVLCRRQIEVVDGETVEAACTGQRPQVSGQVWAGERPAAGGILEWTTTHRDSETAGAIHNFLSPGGLRRQAVFGARPDAVRVEIRADGTFTTDRLLSGVWEVVWIPDGGVRAEPRQIEVPEVEHHTVTLRYADSVVSGRVIDAEGRPLEDAVVQEGPSGAYALTDAAGAFRLTLSPGTHRLQARWRQLRSEIVAVQVEPTAPPEPVDLVVEEPDPGFVVAALTEAGAPASGAFVFVQSDLQGLRLHTADHAGRVQVDLHPPRPEQVRVAVFHEGRWAFTGWHRLAEAGEEIEVALGESGALLMVASEAGGLVRIAGPEGWDLTRLLTLVGHRPVAEAGTALVLRGLPVGRYRVALGDLERSVSVTGGDTERLELE